MSTLALPPFLTNPRQDAIDLYKAFKGFGCDCAAVINIIAHRDATQRALIQQEYRAMYSDELTNRLSSELSGLLKKAMLLWILDPAGRDATVLKQVLGGTGDTVDLPAATEIICSRTPSQIQTIKQIYYAKFGVYLEHDIHCCTSGDHQKVFLDLMIMVNDQTYKNKLKKVTFGFEFALLTILGCAENPAKYFAKVLRKAMKGLGTDDKTLVRVVVTRTELDMQYIKVEYHKKYKKHLHDAIHSETSGHYRTFLLSLVGPLA
ncbi:annexin D5-like [Curcuma longa]|uniref:annexin D5-like n=1 Tax=Curcuma longa TaxID=136217 RepID=UPI003D9EACBE